MPRTESTSIASPSRSSPGHSIHSSPLSQTLATLPTRSAGAGPPPAPAQATRLPTSCVAAEEVAGAEVAAAAAGADAGVGAE
eukprot:scaffold8504_cov83-Phaeocystis_antarctica.AAC.3